MATPIFGRQWTPEFGQQAWRTDPRGHWTLPATGWGQWGRLGPEFLLPEAGALRRLAIGSEIMPFVNPWTRAWFGTQIEGMAGELQKAGAPRFVTGLDVPQHERIRPGEWWDWFGPAGDALRAAGEALAGHAANPDAQLEAPWLIAAGRDIERIAPRPGQFWTADMVRQARDAVDTLMASAPGQEWRDWLGMIIDPTPREYNLDWTVQRPGMRQRWF